MWRYVLLIILSASLVGCSVTIDPYEEEQKNDTTTQENSQQPEAIQETEIDTEIASEEPSQAEGFLDILGDVFHIDLSIFKENMAQDIYYLALGDSLTRGIGDELKKYGYTIRLEEQLEKWPMIKTVELDNRGKNGRRSDQLLALLEKGHYDEELERANLITMTLGGNDVMKVVKNNLFSLKKEMFDKELTKFMSRYETILEEIRLRNPDAPIIIIGFYNPFSIVVDEVTPFEPIITEWNTEIERLANTQTNACFVAIDDLFLSNEDMVYHVDFFHPNSTGYERMTNRIIETMQSCEIEEMSDGLIGIEEWNHE